jgi:YMGG-like Gly-zipper
MLLFERPIAATNAARLNEEDVMRNSVKLLVVPALVLTAACGRDEKPIDQALQNDLSLASSMQGYQPQQFVSPMEMGYGGYGQQAYAPQQPYGYYPQAQPVAQRIYRAPAPRASSGTYSTGTSTGTGTRVVKNTKRDAIIGGVAGAAIGAVTSRDKLKGAVIGGVAGSVLGAVIGNNVDVKKIPY